MTLGMPQEYFIERHRSAGGAAVRAAIRHCESLGAEIVEVSLPHTEYAIGVYYIIATAEASANLARFDGVRYGHRAAERQTCSNMYGRTRAEGFGPEVKRRIILGTYVLSSGYYDAYYLRAQKVRTLIRRDFTHAFENVRRDHLPHVARRRRSRSASTPTIRCRCISPTSSPSPATSPASAASAAVRLRRGGRQKAPDRPATSSANLRGSRAPANRPRLRAVHRLAQGRPK